ncbi:Kelch repeat-containing protein [Streptomyces regalis]|uniref:Kelch repeat-containing protein n=1 Tax=Streptomyces regalis TaxID=68262 RepID=UPI00131DFEFE|nr:kelch repeat-containing protein [Streptomyces regalis]
MADAPVSSGRAWCRRLLVAFLAPLLALTPTLAHAQAVWLTLPGMPTARLSHAAATAPCPQGVPGLRGTCVYTFGGRNAFGNGPLNTVEAYSPDTNTWRTLPELPTARFALGGVAAPCPQGVPELRGTCVYAIGGFTGSDWPNPSFNARTVEAYSPVTNTWRTLPELPTARSFLAGATAPCPVGVPGLRGTCVYAIGGDFGNAVEAYSPVTNAWRTLPSLGTSRDAPAGASAPCPQGVPGLSGTCVYAIGGFNFDDEILNTVEAYSPTTNTWRPLPSMGAPNVALAGASASCPPGVPGLAGTCVYAFGGFNFSEEVLDRVEAYSPATNTWRTLPDLPTARFELAGTTAPCPTAQAPGITCVYALGGADSSFNARSTVEAFAL